MGSTKTWLDEEKLKNSSITASFSRVFGPSNIPVEGRALFLFVVCLEIVAFSMLYFFPAQSAIYWPWVISEPRSAMSVSVIYIGGLIYYLPGLFAKEWRTVQNGMIGLIVFSIVLLVPNILHWPLFRPYHPITLVWFAVYYALPLFVPIIYKIQSTHAEPIVPDAIRISPALNKWLIIRGAIYLALAVFGLIFAESVCLLWPWSIQPIDLRVFMAAVATVGWAGLVSLSLSSERLWQRHRLGTISTGVMGLALLFALVINSSPYNWTAPLGIALFVVYVDWFITSVIITIVYERRDRKRQ